MIAALKKENPGVGAPGHVLPEGGNINSRPDFSQYSPIAQEKALKDELLSAALSYAKRYAVYPVGINGRPLINWNEVTTPESLVREWWGRWPFAMIGINLGLWTGVYCLKVADRASLDTLKALGWSVPETMVEVITPHEEQMLFFRPDPLEVAAYEGMKGEIASGIELWGTGYFAVLPPSRPDLGGPDFYFAEGQEIEAGCLV